MHAVLITFPSSAHRDKLGGPRTDDTRALGGVPGLVATTWLRDGATLGGVHVCASRQAADADLGGALVDGLTASRRSATSGSATTTCWRTAAAAPAARSPRRPPATAPHHAAIA